MLRRRQETLDRIEGKLPTKPLPPLRKPSKLRPRKNKKWRVAIRAQLVKRDGKICHWCKKPKDRLTIDHVTRRADGGADDLENLVLACKPCNQERDSRLK